MGLVALGITVPTVVYFASSSARRTVDAIGVHRFTLMHAWRAPAALLFFVYGVAASCLRHFGFWWAPTEAAAR